MAAGFYLTARDRRAFARAAIWGFLPAVALAAHNAICFGNPFSLGYGKLEASQFGSHMTSGFFGVTWPQPARVLQLTFGTYRGLFFYCPLLLLPLAAIPFAWRRHRAHTAAILAAVTAALLLNASYGYWQGGVCFGPRHLVPIIPLLALLFADLPAHWWRNPIAIALAVLSIAFNLAPTVTTPFISEYDTNPLAHSYRQLVMGQAVSINPNRFLTPENEMRARWEAPQHYGAASWNWGERAGLSDFRSLLPLAALTLVFLLGLSAFG